MEEKNVDHGNDQEKLFTQEEVNAIIKKRLERIRAEESKQTDAETAARTAALDQREQELNRKAMSLECKSYLSDQGYDADLFDVISADNLDDFKAKADKLSGMIANKRNTSFAAPLGDAERVNADPVDDVIKAAFDPGYKHKPTVKE